MAGIPVIDLPSISAWAGYVLIFRTAISWLQRALTWIKDKALTALIFTKFTATAAFIATLVLILAGLSAAVSFIVGQIVSLVIPSAPSISNEYLRIGSHILGQAVDFDVVFSVANTILTCLTVYFSVCKSHFVLRLTVRIYDHIRKCLKV